MDWKGQSPKVGRLGRKKADAVIQARNSDGRSSGGSSSDRAKVTHVRHVKEVESKVFDD